MNLTQLREKTFKYLTGMGLHEMMGAGLVADAAERRPASDREIKAVFGGKRGTKCPDRFNTQGPCKYKTKHPASDFWWDTEAIPAFEFNLKGEDPSFLGGLLNDFFSFWQALHINYPRK